LLGKGVKSHHIVSVAKGTKSGLYAVVIAERKALIVRGPASFEKRKIILSG